MLTGLARFSTQPRCILLCHVDLALITLRSELLNNNLLPFCRYFFLNNLDSWVPYSPTKAQEEQLLYGGSVIFGLEQPSLEYYFPLI